MNRFFVLALTFVLTFGFASGQTVKDSHSNSTESSFALYNGVMLYLMGNTDMAKTVLKKNLDSNPGHSPSYYYLAKMAYEGGDVGQSSDFIGKAIAIDSLDVDYMLLQGQIYIASGNYPGAQKIFNELTSLQSDPQYYIMNTALLLEMGDNASVIEQSDDYEAKYGLDERIVELKYMALIRSRRYYDVETYLEQACTTFPLSPQFLISLADVNTALGRDSVAEINYRRAIAIDSTDEKGYLALARFYQYKDNVKQYLEVLTPYFMLKEVDAAPKIEIFNREFFTPNIYRDNYPAIRRIASALLLSAPDNEAVRIVYGRYLTYTGQIEQALEHYILMYGQGIETEEVCENISQILIYQKDFKRADSILTLAVAKYPQSISLTQGRIVCRWLGSDIDGALKLADAAIKRFKTDSTASMLYSIKGDIYHEMGDKKKCYAAYDKALRYDPNNSAVLNNYAYFLALEGRNLERALAMATAATEISTANATYLDTKAWVLYTMGRYLDAMQVQQAALGLDTTNSPELLLHYGDMLYSNGDDFLARTYWKKALEAGADKNIIEQRLSRPKALNNR